jgi:hypothetical protein
LTADQKQAQNTETHWTFDSHRRGDFGHRIVGIAVSIMQVRRQNAWPPTTTNYAQNSGGLAAQS